VTTDSVRQTGIGVDQRRLDLEGSFLIIYTMPMDDMRHFKPCCRNVFDTLEFQVGFVLIITSSQCAFGMVEQAIISTLPYVKGLTVPRIN
jgi:hypothetical protein